MFKKIKEFFTGKPAEVTAEVPYKVEAPAEQPLVKLGPEPTEAPAPVVEAPAPAPEAPAKKKPAPKKAPAAKQAPAAKKPRAPKAPKAK